MTACDRLVNFEDTLRSFHETQERIKTKAYHLQNAFSRAYDEQDEVMAEWAKQKKGLTELQQSIKDFLEDGVIDSDQYRNYSSQLRDASKELHHVHFLFPVKGPLISCLLGNVNVRMFKRKERLAYKKEYESFKLKNAPLFVVFSTAVLLTRQIWVDKLYQLYLIYYYITIAVREHILSANGSRIRGWWNWHHYLTIGLCVVILTWHMTTSYWALRPMLYAFNVYSALVQILQTRYQMARLYTLRSLGRAADMDVASTDSSASLHWSHSMIFLLPFLLLSHVLQFFISYRLISSWWLYDRETPQPLGAGLIFFLLGAGNLRTVLVTLRQKYTKSGSSDPAPEPVPPRPTLTTSTSAPDFRRLVEESSSPTGSSPKLDPSPVAAFARRPRRDSWDSSSGFVRLANKTPSGTSVRQGDADKTDLPGESRNLHHRTLKECPALAGEE